MDITNRNASASEEKNLSVDFVDLTTLPDMYEKKYYVELYTMSGDIVDYEQNPVTLYIPCERDDCYIIFISYAEGEPVQLEAEYVDGYYKVQMTDMGSFMICENPLLEGEGELVQQTLVDEETGVSVSGIIESGSSLYVITIKDLYDHMVSMFNNEESYRYGSSFNLGEKPIAMATKMDGYLIYVVRNFEKAQTEGELIVTLPNENEGYEVRCFDTTMPMSDSDGEEDEALGFDIFYPSSSHQELADKVNAFANRVYPALDAEYIDGSYVVTTEYLQYVFIAPSDAFALTADDIKAMRDSYSSYSDYEVPSDPPTSSATDTSATETSTQASTVAPTQTSNQTSTQSATQSSSTQGKSAVSTSDSIKLSALLLIIGVATITIVVIRKKRLSK